MKKKILIGSINAVLISLISLLVLSTHSVNAADANEKYIAAKSGLNLRSDPNKSSKVVTLIPFGAKVTIEKSDGKEIFLDGRYGKWVNVKYENKTGWVFSGFLCDFKPDTVIKPAADFYRNKYMKNEDVYISENKKLTHFKDREVSIKNILDNYIILKIPSLGDGKDVVWKYDVKQKIFFEVHVFEADEENCLDDWAAIFYLDNDKYPDLIFDKATGYESSSINIFLGSKSGFTKIYDSPHFDANSMHSLTTGSCGEMALEYNEYGIRYFFRFNCDARKFEKYAESKIIESKGTITSIDFKNRSIIIKDKKDLKDKSYKFSTYFTDESLKYFEELKKKKEVVSFSYATIDDKKIIIAID